METHSAPRSSVAALLASCLCLSGAACSPQAPDVLDTAEGGSGDVCATTDAEGLATIGWEQISNVSDAPVEVQSIDFATSGIDVVEWAIFPAEWTGGVLSGDQMPADEGSHRIEPGANDLVVMVLRLDSATQSPGAVPRLTYRDGEGHEGALDLTWSVTLLPHGHECGT